MIREAVDDLRRYRRDLEVNGARYQRVELTDNRVIPSSDIRVGDLIVIEKVPVYHVELYSNVVMLSSAVTCITFTMYITKLYNI